MPLGTWFGVRVRVHPLFLPLAAIAVFGGRGAELLILLALLFTHELAHLLVAAAYELDIREVELLPFGGVARVEGLEAAEPGVESVVALAGPLNNLFLLALATLLRPLPFLDPRLLEFFISGNLALALFNLLPALPLDGGRFLRGILIRPFGYRRATRLLSKSGEVCALLLGIGALSLVWRGLFVPNAFILAAFLYMAARREADRLVYGEMGPFWRKDELLARRGSLPVQPLLVAYGLTLREVRRRLDAHRYAVIWVADERLRVVGVLHEGAIRAGFERHGPDLPVGRLLDDPS